VQAVILAGGLGTRLRSVLGDLPKPLAPVQGRPFLEYLIEHLRQHDVTRVVLCVGYRRELLQQHFGDGSALGVQIAYSVEREPLGTGGALWQARSLLDATFLVLNGDTFFAANLAALIQAHADGGIPATGKAVATIALRHMPDVARYGDVVLDEIGCVTQFNEKGRAGPGLINAGAYVFSRQIFELVQTRTPLSMEKDVFPELARRRALRGCILQGYYVDIGLPDSYAEFQRHVRLTEISFSSTKDKETRRNIKKSLA
jgi:NDP-sugar pyrophosphorylase family protein